MSRKTSTDYGVLAMETKLDKLKFDPEDLKARQDVFNYVKNCLDKYVETLGNIPFQFLPTEPVGSVVDGTTVGIPIFDLLLAINMEDAYFSEPTCGLMEASLTRIGIKRLKSQLTSFLDDKRRLNANAIGKHVREVITMALDYYKVLPGSFLKHNANYYENKHSRLTIELVDRQDGETKLYINVIPVLQIRNDGILTTAVPSDDTTQTFTWIQDFSVKEVDMILGLEKKNEFKGCEKDCIRLLKAVLISSFPELPVELAKMLVLNELISQKNTISHWGYDELKERFTDLISILRTGLQAKVIPSVHSRYAGGSINMLEGVKETEKALQKLTGKSSDVVPLLIGQINIRKSRKPSMV